MLDATEAELWGNISEDEEARTTAYEATVTHELRRYLVNPHRKKFRDPLEYWAFARKEFPRLYEVALHALTSAATSIKSESTWSHAGQLESVRRTMLHTRTLDHLLFIH